jgi:ABC-type uncharacterized transport system permease subunit
MLSDILTPELFASAVRLATPIALAAVGASICERSGIVNIATDGRGEELGGEDVAKHCS